MLKGRGGTFAALLVVAAALYSVGWSERANAQARYPTKAVNVIIAIAPGGGFDTTTRIAAEYLKKTWAVPINVINKPGGNSVPGILEVYNAAPDGYTMMGDDQISSSLINVAMKELPFKTMDRTHIATVAAAPYVLIVPVDSPFKTLGDLLSNVRANPEAVTYTSLGGAGGVELFIRKIFVAAGVDPQKPRAVLSKGGGEAVRLTAGGHVMIGASTASGVLPALRAGTVRALLITSKSRHPQMPDVPTSSELGFPAVDIVAWWGFSGPPKLPDHIVKVWESTLEQMVKDPNYVAMLEKVSAVPLYRNARDTRKYIEGEIADARQLLK